MRINLLLTSLHLTFLAKKTHKVEMEEKKVLKDVKALLYGRVFT